MHAGPFVKLKEWKVKLFRKVFCKNKKAVWLKEKTSVFDRALLPRMNFQVDRLRAQTSETFIIQSKSKTSKNTSHTSEYSILYRIYVQ